jgi:hypothetical protein
MSVALVATVRGKLTSRLLKVRIVYIFWAASCLPLACCGALALASSRFSV